MFQFFRSVAVLIALAGLVPITDSIAASSVIGVRAGEQAEATRFVMDLSAAVDFEVFLLDRPYRVVVDFPVLKWQVPVTPTVQRGLIDGFRFGLFDRTTSRLVLDVNKPVEVRRTFVLPPSGSSPYRFVIDLAEVAADKFKRVVAVPARPTGLVPLVKPAATAETKSEGRRVVILDPGHGGIDPGTIGRRGALEKTLTLAIAKEDAQGVRSDRSLPGVSYAGRGCLCPITSSCGVCSPTGCRFVHLAARRLAQRSNGSWRVCLYPL